MIEINNVMGWNIVLLLLAILMILFVLLGCVMNRKRNLAQKEKELMESQMSLVISQIQPHFLYNTLSTIAELCQTDAVMAEELTNRFAIYLRANLEHMGDSVPIDFKKELRHVQTYLWIEKIRFQEDLNVVYDIQVDDFKIPALTIQPLVENAVRHGMRGSENVCTVMIRTRKTEQDYEIVIEDDGCGFDLAQNEKKESGKQVGIDNVKKRLKWMVQGTITIESEMDKGTTAVIRIPVNDH